MFLTFCGIPGSGKTTLSNQLAEHYNAKLYCYDSFPHAHHPRYTESIHLKMWRDIVEDLQSGKSVVCDDINIKFKWRKDLLQALDGVDCKRVLIVMTTPLEECLQRNANRKHRLPDWVIQSLAEKYEPPTYEEGWDEIIYM